MILESAKPYALRIPFAVAFKHAAAERDVTQTILVNAESSNGIVSYGEGCPREYVTGETLATAKAFVIEHLEDWRKSIHDVNSLASWIDHHRRDIDSNAAAWTAVELALLDLLGKEAKQSVESLLAVRALTGKFRYTAILGDSAPSQFEAQLKTYLRSGFRDFKIKLSGDWKRDLSKTHALLASGIDPHGVRADANNLWQSADAAIADLKAIGYPFSAIEEPLQTGDFDGMRRLASALNTKIVLDESMLRISQLDLLAGTPSVWTINVRISKMGGLLRSLEFVEQLRARGLRMILGAHVGETSILTRAALTVANCAQDILIAQEGAFGTHLLTRDIADPPIMFGEGGIVDVSVLEIAQTHGFGLALLQPIPHITAI